MIILQYRWMFVYFNNLTRWYYNLKHPAPVTCSLSHFHYQVPGILSFITLAVTHEAWRKLTHISVQPSSSTIHFLTMDWCRTDIHKRHTHQHTHGGGFKGIFSILIWFHVLGRTLQTCWLMPVIPGDLFGEKIWWIQLIMGCTKRWANGIWNVNFCLINL